MKLTKYKDFIGEASADRNDPKNEGLKKFLINRGLRPDQYDPIGIGTSFYSGKYHYSIICRNPDDPTNKNLIKLYLKPEITKEEFYGLVDTYASFVVYNHDINPADVEEFTEHFENT